MATEPSELRPARVRVPASTSNLGSGFDCIGLAVSRYLDAAYEPGDAPLRIERAGTLSAPAPWWNNTAWIRCTHAVCSTRRSR